MRPVHGQTRPAPHQGPRPVIDPGFNRNQQMPPPNRGSQGWLQKHPNGPLAGGRGQGGGNLGMPQQQGFDYDAFNAWQDPNIGGEQPGPIQAGWGGASGQQGNSMLMTKMNNYLNQQAVGGDRENMMNQMGYFNGGNAFNPQSFVGQGYNRLGRANAQSGEYSAPGIYQQMDAGNTGYLGVSNIGEDGTGTYTPFATRGRTRRSGTTGGRIY